jgi:hypothetical protein
MLLSFVVFALAGAAAALDREAPALGFPTLLPIQVEDELARRRLGYLTDRSATMKQLLEVLETTPAISVRLRSNPMLWRDARRMAIGRFRGEGAQVVVLLQFDSEAARPVEQIEWVAHELAHAVEVACLPTAIEINRIRIELRRRGRRVRDMPGLAVETPFAENAGRAMLIEALRGRPGVGRLPELAQKYNLGPPCARRGDHPSSQRRN